MKTCCCTGHRPKKFPFKYGVDIQKHNEYLRLLEQKIEYAICECGVTNFISGMALGVDLDFAEIVLKLKKKYPITFGCALPCRNQIYKWNCQDQMRYRIILECADRKIITSFFYTKGCMLERNRYMVDQSDLVIAVFNGIKRGGTWYTLNYAQKENKQIELIDLRSI